MPRCDALWCLCRVADGDGAPPCVLQGARAPAGSHGGCATAGGQSARRGVREAALVHPCSCLSFREHSQAYVVSCSDDAKLEAVTTSQDTYRSVVGERRQPIVREDSWQEYNYGGEAEVRRCARQELVAGTV